MGVGFPSGRPYYSADDGGVKRNLGSARDGGSVVRWWRARQAPAARAHDRGVPGPGDPARPGIWW